MVNSVEEMAVLHEKFMTNDPTLTDKQKEFIALHDISFPLAWAFQNKYITALSHFGITKLVQTWNGYCDLIGIEDDLGDDEYEDEDES